MEGSYILYSMLSSICIKLLGILKFFLRGAGGTHGENNWTLSSLFWQIKLDRR